MTTDNAEHSMADPTPVPEYDDDDYPTEESVTAIESFVGTPEALIEYATALFNGGYVTVADAVDWMDRNTKQVTFITCGWSGAESVLSTLSHHTMFNMLFWHSSYRGGKTIFEIPVDRWTTPRSLGRFDLPGATPSPTKTKEPTDV